MILKLVRSLFSYILLVPVLLVVGLPCLILMLLPQRWRYDNRILFWFFSLFYKSVLFVTFLPITFQGKENIPTDPAIIVANHQSALDIPLVGSLLNGFSHVWLATVDLTTTWLAPVLHRMAVLVDMSTPQKGMRTLLQAIARIQEQQRHAIIFPEGGRYLENNHVREFFSGFAMLAQRTNRPVVPVMIFDAYKVYPPHSFLIHWNPIHVVVGPMFMLREGEELDAFRDRVRQWFVEQVAKTEI